jgi:hypothetical protein
MNTLSLTSLTIEPHTIWVNYQHNGADFRRGFGFADTVDLMSFQSDDTWIKLAQYAAITDSIYTFGLAYFDVIHLPFALTSDEKDFFEDAFLHGLAEFRYVNNLTIDRPTTFTWDADAPLTTATDATPGQNSRAFVLNGGGKDGIVAIEIAKQLDLDDVAWFVSGSAEARNRVAEASGITHVTAIRRLPSPYIAPNRVYKGHKPMSLFVAMSASLAAYMDNRQYVIAANEYSASFPNVTVDGFDVNHQHTKSLAFELSLRTLFDAHHIPVHYFSITRPLYELQVLHIFAKYPQYHTIFLSCNQEVQLDRWCMNCAKCAFVIGAMYLYSPESAKTVWGSSTDVFDQNTLVDELIELVSPHVKPLECIGTLAENRYLIQTLVDRELVRLNDQQATYFHTLMSEGDATEPVDLALYDRPTNYPNQFDASIKEIIASAMDDK